MHTFFRHATFNKGSYVGDGTTNGRFILTSGCKPFFILINQRNENIIYLSFTITNSIKFSEVVMSGTNVSRVELTINVHIESNNDGFIIGDGSDEANENGIDYDFISIG